MERLRLKISNSAVSKPILWFCLGMLFTAAVLFALGIPLAEHCSKQISGEITRELLSKCGSVAIASEEEDWEFSPDSLAFAWSEKSNDTALSKGVELMSPYGYKLDMNETMNPYYRGLKNKLTFIILAFAGLILLILFVIGLILIDSVTRRISGLTRCAEQLLEEKGGSYPEGLMGVLGRHTMILKQYAARTERLLSALREEKNRMKDFLSDISHQIKTPAAVLKLNHELLLDDPNMEVSGREDFLNRDLVQLERLEWLLAGLLKLARMDAGSVEYDREPHSMRETAAMVLSSFHQTALKKGVSLVNEIPENMVFSYDDNWIQEALGNLVKNALEHSKPQGGVITCGGTVTPMTAELYVSDNGSGVPPEDLPHIFDRFYTKSSAVNPAGAGIGLSLSAKIFEAFDGKISASSKLGEGTRFTVSFLTKM